MGIKAEPIATNPLATARQLWRLNKDCQLVAKVIGHQDGPLTAAQADALIRACSAPLPAPSQTHVFVKKGAGSGSERRSLDGTSAA